VCTILLAWRCHHDASIILAANRDELIARASSPPGVLSSSPLVMGGRDLVAGGTWLAVADGGTICAVTNRHPGTGKPEPPDPTRRSRGEIPLSLLTGVEARDVPARLAVLGPGRYNPVNVVWVSADRALVAEVDDSGPVRVIDLEPGAHVLTTGDLDDRALPKVAMLRAGMDSALAAGGVPGEILLRMRALLASHVSPTDRPVDAACIHGDVYGTVSASSVVVGHRGVTYEHAPGRPCVTPFARVATPD
jgi:uncharacterized protein with NRDE domain